MIRVTNVGVNPVEAAGLVFRPRRTVEVSLTPDQLDVVRAHRRLRVDDSEQPAVALESMTVAQLEDHAARRGIDLAGTRKAEIVAEIAAAEGGGEAG